MWSFIKGLLGNYKGQQRTTPYTSITPTDTAPSVSNALQIPAVWECTQKIVKAMACMPLDLLREVDQEGNTEVIRSGQLFHLLSESPNANMTPADFIKVITTDYLLYGNAYIRIDYARGADYVAALTPLNPKQIEVINEGPRVVYRHYTQDEELARYPAERILHWKGIGNGLAGFSMIDFARATVDEAAKAQSASADLFRNKGKLNGILCSDNPILKDTQIRQFLDMFTEMKKADIGVPLLPQGFRFQSLGLSPVETQLLQTREYIDQEFAKWFGIPYALLTGEAQDLVELSNYFYETVILPMCIELEQVLQYKLIKEPGVRVKFRTSVLKRMSDQTRIAMQTSYVQNGLRTRNELRREDGYHRIEGADELTAQNNLYPVDKLGASDPTQTPQTPLTEQPVKQ